MDHTRHIGIFSLQEWPITLIGAGGIGSPTAVALAKMGAPFLAVFDDDDVSEENVATQLYGMGDVGTPKADAAMSLIYRLADPQETVIIGVKQRVQPGMGMPEDVRNPLIISAVDSIQARKDIWAVIKNMPWLWYIDARMGAETLQVMTVNGKDRSWYEQMIERQQDKDIPDLPCTAKATVYCGWAAAAVIGSLVRKIATGQKPPRLINFDLTNYNSIVMEG